MTTAPVILAPELRALLETSPDAVLIVNRAGRIAAVNHRVEALFGVSARHLLDQPVETLLPERARRAHAAARGAYSTAPTVRAMSHRSGLTGRRADGSEFPVEVSLTPIIGSDDGLVLAVVHDVAARSSARPGAAAPDWRSGALDAIPDAIFTTDTAGRIESINRAAEALTGWAREAARGQALEDVLPLLDEATGERLRAPVPECLGQAAGGTLEAVLKARPGHDARTLDLSTTPIRDAAGAVIGAAVVARDVTQARLIARRLAHQATHDPLTGLVNRAEFERRLTHALSSATTGRAQHILCFVDLDGFKLVNDSCGHQAGDELLRQLSEIMRERMRSRDTLGRLGGDEFGVLLEHCGRPQAERIAEGIRRAIAAHQFVAGGQTHTVSASIGLVPIRHGSRPADVLRRADAACYAAKRAGGDRVYIAAASPRAGDIPREGAWARRVARIVEEGRFKLFAQPLVPLGGGTVRAPRLELLLRLEDERGRGALPRPFLTAARRRGLLPRVDDWVVHEAIRRLAEWSRAREGSMPPMVAVNLGDETVANRQARPLVEAALAPGDVPASALCFEITEATIVAHPKASADLIGWLREAGCRTTVEHCGTGMGAFTQLRRLRPDFLKIAGHIVQALERDPVQRALATALNEVGHALGSRTIGVQVEGECILAHLRRIGVDFAQGFGVGRPEPFAEAVAKLA